MDLMKKCPVEIVVAIRTTTLDASLKEVMGENAVWNSCNLQLWEWLRNKQKESAKANNKKCSNFLRFTNT